MCEEADFAAVQETLVQPTFIQLGCLEGKGATVSFAHFMFSFYIHALWGCHTKWLLGYTFSLNPPDPAHFQFLFAVAVAALQVSSATDQYTQKRSFWF